MDRSHHSRWAYPLDTCWALSVSCSGLRGTNAMEGTGGARGTARVFTGRAASSAKAVGRGKPGSDTALGVASGKRSADRENQAKRRRERGARRPDPRAPRFAASLTFWTEVRRRRPGGHRTPPTPNTAAASSHALRALTEQPRETSMRLQNPRGLRGTGRVVRPHLRLAPHACGDPETKGLSHVSRRRAAEP